MVVAVSGSLRKLSLNASLIRAAIRLAPAGVTVIESPSYRDVPMFDADLTADEPLPAARSAPRSTRPTAS